MKNIIFLCFLLVITNCARSNVVYWCGDHPCINKKEKEAYFKKTMIVEIKDLKKNSNKNNSEIEEITKRARLDEKKRIKEEKDLAKQLKLEKKRRLKEEKDLAKKLELEEKKLKKQAKVEKKIQINKEKDLSQKKVSRDSKKSIKIGTNTEASKIQLNNFSELVDKITKENTLRPYPDINDIPN